MTLTPRQSEVARRLLAGLTQVEVAHELGISRRTVEHHAAMLRLKTGATSTRRAVARTVARNPARPVPEPDPVMGEEPDLEAFNAAEQDA